VALVEPHLVVVAGRELDRPLVHLVPVPLLRHVGSRKENQVAVGALGQHEFNVVVAEQADLSIRLHPLDERVFELEEHLVVDSFAGAAEEPDRRQVRGLDQRAGAGDDEKVSKTRLILLVRDDLARGCVTGLVPLAGERALAIQHVPHDVALPLGVLGIRERAVREDVLGAENGLVFHSSQDKQR
jgi:hypothetical protein